VFIDAIRERGDEIKDDRSLMGWFVLFFSLLCLDHSSNKRRSFHLLQRLKLMIEICDLSVCDVETLCNIDQTIGIKDKGIIAKLKE